jgi:hypothetical protein
MSENNNAQSNASGWNQKILLAAFGVIIVVLVGVVAVLLTRPTQDSAEAVATPQRAVLVTEDNIEEAISDLSQPVEVPLSYRATMTTTWRFPDGASASQNAYVENSEANTTPVYFDLVLRDSGETLLESPIIPIGASMRNIKLDKPLAAGTYPAVVVYHLVDDEQNTLTTVHMGVTLVIAN